MYRSVHIICLSSSIDRYLIVDGFSIGSAVRARKVVDFASGKGTNSSCALSALELPHNLFTFFGMPQSREFQLLNNEFCKLHGYSLNGPGRQNVTVVDSQNSLISHIQTPAYHLGLEHVNVIHSYVNDCIITGDVVLISGSLPLGIGQDFYDRIINLIRAKGVFVFADLDPDFFSENSFSKIDLLRINANEASRVFGFKIDRPEHLIQIVDRKESRPAILIVSFGENGAVILNECNEGYLAKGSGKLLTGDATGSGDAMSGIMAHAISRNVPLVEAARMGIAAGAANLLTPGPGRLTAKDYAVQLSESQVQQIF